MIKKGINNNYNIIILYPPSPPPPPPLNLCIRWGDAAGLVRLHLLCYPESDLAELLKEQTQSLDKATDNDLIEVCMQCSLSQELISLSLSHSQAFWKWVGDASQLKQDNEQDSGHDKNNDRGHTSNGAL